MQSLQLPGTALYAYMDESLDDKPLPLTVVAGYLFDAEGRERFDNTVSALLQHYGIEYFRMSACAHRTKQFKEKTPAECIATEKAMIAAVRAHALFGFAVGVSQAEFDLLKPIGSDGMLGYSAYNMLCQWCLQECGRWGDRNNFTGRIAYFFEAGWADQSEANSYMNLIATDTVLVSQFRYASHYFILKKDAPALQAADLLAWQYRHWISSGKEKVRRDFEALIEQSGLEHRYRHLEADAITEMFHLSSMPGSVWYKPGEQSK